MPSCRCPFSMLTGRCLATSVPPMNQFKSETTDTPELNVLGHAPLTRQRGLTLCCKVWTAKSLSFLKRWRLRLDLTPLTQDYASKRKLAIDTFTAWVKWCFQERNQKCLLIHFTRNQELGKSPLLTYQMTSTKALDSAKSALMESDAATLSKETRLSTTARQEETRKMDHHNKCAKPSKRLWTRWNLLSINLHETFYNRIQNW